MLTSAYSLCRLPDKALSVSTWFALTGRWHPGSQGTFIPGPYWLFTDRPISRSPRIRALTFTAQPHHLQWPLDHVASLSCASSPPAYASYDVLVHQLTASPKAPTVGASGLTAMDGRNAENAGAIFCPSDSSSRIDPCHSLVVIV